MKVRNYVMTLLLLVVLTIGCSGCVEVASFLGGAGTTAAMQELKAQAVAKQREYQVLLEHQEIQLASLVTNNEELIVALETANSEAEKEALQTEIEIAVAKARAMVDTVYETKRKMLYNEGYIGAINHEAVIVKQNMSPSEPEDWGGLLKAVVGAGLGGFAWLKRKEALEEAKKAELSRLKYQAHKEGTEAFRLRYPDKAAEIYEDIGKARQGLVT